MDIDADLIPLLDEMYYELSTERLEVCLVPRSAEDDLSGRMLRVAVSRNPDWYQDLCRRYPCTRSKKRSARKDYTRINRKHILGVLANIVRRGRSVSKYTEDLVAEAADRLSLYTSCGDDMVFQEWDNQF